MLRSTPQAQRLLLTLRHQTSRAPLRPSYVPISRRLASTSTGANRSSSWRSFFVRLGLAGGVIYYYNTADIFQPQPAFIPSGPETPATQPPTLESIAAERQQKRQAPTPVTTSSGGGPPPLGSETPALTNPESLEAEADQQGAFNPETGEINWDCPCLGGMAHGPCGDEFKAAFSCFVYSEAEPKGMDCVDKFKGMQDCFRAHPDVYAAELEDDEDEEAAPAASAAADGEAATPRVESAGEAPSVAAKIQEDAVTAAETTKEAVKGVISDAKERTASAVDATKRAIVQAEDKSSENAAKAADATQRVIVKAGDKASEKVTGSRD